MPIYSINRGYKKTLSEDREAFLLADRLGFSEACCGEHVTYSAENNTSSALFIASLAAETKNIRLGTRTVNIPNSHPISVNFLMPKWVKTHCPEYNKMLFLINKNTKKTFRWAKLHIRNQKYMNRLLSLNKWDNPSTASPFIII
jgi:hypothetical protein